MIIGATRGRGGPALARHLCDAKMANDATRTGASRGLVRWGVHDQVEELTGLAAHARHAAPLYHVHANPEGKWPEATWQDFWSLFEEEFGLKCQEFSEVIHGKGRRTHRHRVYSLVRADGTCIPVSHDYARHEYLARMAELRTGASLTKGAHNHAVLARLDREGSHEAASALRAAGLHEGPRPRAPVTPGERAQADRTGVDPLGVRHAVLQAWQSSDDGLSLVAALAADGLVLVQGRSGPGVLDARGGFHRLTRALAWASGAAGLEPIRAAVVHARLNGITLPSHAPGRRRANLLPPPQGADHAERCDVSSKHVTRSGAIDLDRGIVPGSAESGACIGDTEEKGQQGSDRPPVRGALQWGRGGEAPTITEASGAVAKGDEPAPGDRQPPAGDREHPGEDPGRSADGRGGPPGHRAATGTNRADALPVETGLTALASNLDALEAMTRRLSAWEAQSPSAHNPAMDHRAEALLATIDLTDLIALTDRLTRSVLRPAVREHPTKVSRQVSPRAQGRPSAPPPQSPQSGWLAGAMRQVKDIVRSGSTALAALVMPGRRPTAPQRAVEAAARTPTLPPAVAARSSTPVRDSRGSEAAGLLRVMPMRSGPTPVATFRPITNGGDSAVRPGAMPPPPCPRVTVAPSAPRTVPSGLVPSRQPPRPRGVGGAMRP